MTWKRTFLLFLACFVVLATGTWIVLRQTGVATSLVRDALAAALAAPFELEAAEIDLPRGLITVRGLQVADPRGGAAPLLTAAEVRVSVNTNPLGAVGQVHKVVIAGLAIPDLRVTGPDALRLGDIVREGAGTAGAGGCPEIVIEDAVVGVRFSPSAPPLRFEHVDLEVLPAEPDGTTAVLAGAMTTPIGTRVQLGGQGDLANLTLRVTAKAEGLEISRRAVEPFSPAAAAQLAATGVRGRVPSAQLWFEYDGRRDTAPRGGFLAELTDVSFSAGHLLLGEGTGPDPRPIEHLSGKISGQLQDGGTVTVMLQSPADGEQFAIAGTLRRLFGAAPDGDLRVGVTALRIDAALLDGARAHPAAANIVDAIGLEPMGDVDATVDLHLAENRVRVELDAHVRGTAATYHGFAREDGSRQGFPMRLTDVAGSVRLRGQTLHVQGVRARDSQGARLEFDGSFPLGDDAPPGSIVARATGLVFRPELRSALLGLGSDLAPHYDDYAPAGITDAEVRISDLGHDRMGSLLVRIQPRQAEASWLHLPCRVHKLHGRVEIDQHGVVLDLTGERSDRPLAVRGRFRVDDSAAPGRPGDDAHRHELWVRSEGLLLDDELRQGLITLVPRLAGAFDTLVPSGRLAAELAFWQAAGAPRPSYDLRINLLDVGIQPSLLPAAVRSVTGTVFVHGDGDDSRAELQLVRGGVVQLDGAAPAQVLVSGSVATTGGDTEIDLSTVVMGLRLDAQLADVLDRTGAFSRASWDVFAPSGSIDVTARHQHRLGGGAPRQHLRVQLRDVSSNAAILPAPASGLTGEVIVADGTATFRDVRGLIGSAPITVREGRIFHETDATRVRAIVTADDFPVNDDLARLFGDSPLRETYLRRQPRGRVKITELKLEFSIPDRAAGAGDFDLRFSGQLLARNCAFVLAVPIEEANGVLTVRDGSVNSGGGQISGSLSGLSMTVLGRHVTDLDASFVATPADFTFGDLGLRLHGGRVTGIENAPHLRYATAGEGTLTANLQWQGVRLSELLGDGSRSGLRGSVNGQFRLDSLPGTRLLDMRGTGNLQVSAGKLGEVPLFRGIYALLQRHPQFTGAELDFVLGDRRVDIPKLALTSQLVDVRGKGSLTMDGYLDMTLELPSLFGDGADFLILPQLLHNAFSKVVEFKVHGYLRAPVVTPVVLFQGTPGRRPLEPIPAVIPDLPRRRF